MAVTTPTEHPMFRRSRAAELALVAVGTAIGLALTAAIWLVAYPRLPVPQLVSAPEQLTGAARLLVWPAAWMFMLVLMVANSRLVLDALNPLRRSETRFIDTTIRVLTNTTEQTVIFAFALLALGAKGGAAGARAAPLLTFLFVLGRILYWIGYIIDPMYRGTGLWMTWAVNAGIIVYVVLR